MVLKRAILFISLLLVLLSTNMPAASAQRKRRQRGETHMTNQQELDEVEKLERQAEGNEEKLEEE